MHQAVASSNFSLWAASLLTRDPKKVAALYSDDATLIPTMAQRVITDREGIIAYFTFFGSFLPSVSMAEEHMAEISDESYLHCGVYRFRLTRDGKEDDTDARFSMLWQKEKDDWRILHHRSSRIPTV